MVLLSVTLKPNMLTPAMLNIVMLSVVILSVSVLSVVILIVSMLGVVASLELFLLRRKLFFSVRESFVKGKNQYCRPPFTNTLISGSFHASLQQGFYAFSLFSSGEYF